MGYFPEQLPGVCPGLKLMGQAGGLLAWMGLKIKSGRQVTVAAPGSPREELGLCFLEFAFHVFISSALVFRGWVRRTSVRYRSNLFLSFWSLVSLLLFL